MNEKNSTPKIHLREFAYFDRQKIEDFLSGIEDGLIRESMETQRKHGKEVKGEAGIKGILSVCGTTGYNENELQRLKTATDASLFQRLYTYLNEQQMISYIDAINEEAWEQIVVGKILDIKANIELSALDNLIDTVTRVMTFFEKISPEKMDRKTKEAIVGFQMLSQESSKEGFNIKITTIKTPKFKFVATLPSKNIRVTKQELNGEYNVLCRVKKILKKNEKFELFSLIPGFKMDREMIKDFIKSFRNMPKILGNPPKVGDLQVGYPAMVVTPIAIYR